MKTIVIGLIFLGFTSLMQSQNDVAYVNVTNDEVAKVSKTSMINAHYYKSLDSKISSERVRKFQKVVAKYDIKNSDIYYAAEKSNYTVVFEEGDNQIMAEYNHDGKILRCSEQFKNIKLPFKISSDIAKTHPGWEFKEIMCDVTYDIKDNQQVIYRVELQNGNKSKTLKVNANDYNL